MCKGPETTWNLQHGGIEFLQHSCQQVELVGYERPGAAGAVNHGRNVTLHGRQLAVTEGFKARWVSLGFASSLLRGGADGQKEEEAGR